jgi:hypothetical protein
MAYASMEEDVMSDSAGYEDDDDGSRNESFFSTGGATRGITPPPPVEGQGAFSEQQHLRELLSHPEDVYPLPETLYGDAFCTPVENMPILFSSKSPFSYRIIAITRLVTTGLILLLNYSLQGGILYYFSVYDPSAEIPIMRNRMEMALEAVHAMDGGGKYVKREEVTTGDMIFGATSLKALQIPSLAEYGQPMIRFAKVKDQPAVNRTNRSAILGTQYGMNKYNKDYLKVFCGESNTKCSFDDNMCLGSFDSLVSDMDDIAIIGVRWYTFILLIMFVWWSIIYNEMRETLLMGYVVANLPSTSNTSMSTRTEDGNLKVHGLSFPVRVYLYCGVIIPRLVIAYFLAREGTFWLQRTFTVSDLVLNSVALAFLIDVDEILFGAVLSIAKREAVQSVEPIKVDGSKSVFAGLDRCWRFMFGEIAMTVLFFMLLLQYFFTIYLYELGTIQNYFDVICPRDQSAVTLINPEETSTNPFADEGFADESGESEGGGAAFTTDVVIRWGYVADTLMSDWEVEEVVKQIDGVEGVDYCYSWQYVFLRRTSVRRVEAVEDERIPRPLTLVSDTPEGAVIRSLQAEVRDLKRLVMDLANERNPNAQGAAGRAPARRLAMPAFLFDVEAYVWANGLEIANWEESTEVKQGVIKGMQKVWPNKPHEIYGVNFALPNEGGWPYAAIEVEHDIQSRSPLLQEAEAAGYNDEYHDYTTGATYEGTESSGQLYDVAPSDPWNAETDSDYMTYHYSPAPAPPPASWSDGMDEADDAYAEEDAALMGTDDPDIPEWEERRALSYDDFLSGETGGLN